MSDVIYISNAILSFHHLVEPQKRIDSKGNERISYNCDLLFSPEDPAFAAFMKKYGEMALAQWKEHAGSIMQIIQNDRKLRCYGRGEEKVSQTTFAVHDGYAGRVYLTAGNANPPQMIQADGKPVDPSNTLAYQALARKMYRGCYVNAAVKPWLQKNENGRGIRCDLIAIQFVKDGTPLGDSSIDVSSMFGAVTTPAAPTINTIPGLPPFML